MQQACILTPRSTLIAHQECITHDPRGAIQLTKPENGYAAVLPATLMLLISKGLGQLSTGHRLFDSPAWKKLTATPEWENVLQTLSDQVNTRDDRLGHGHGQQ